ncbi:XRE family transcriptional regulator [Sphingomonas gilva]|uniref:XRE family transcriptional regulator n=1 Tax=Sphingomonas gilva TaxID=2305907 RepID=A0A396RRR8_9SPHN|nr:helix-turn-helix transcriptional regulator [Sphingomonas gilva]RHW19344.1 XRE family transcriptional regulator [Sphingomonas gilva]
MTVQIVEISGQKMAMLPIADYERLIDLVEDRLDAASAAEAARRREDGEEYLPASLVDQILAGESALRVWRRHRGLTQSGLAKVVGTTKMTVSSLELGKREGSRKMWCALADALRTSVDDILPAK